MKYLDYTRLLDNVDPTLKEFLLGVYEQDTLRRVWAAFPEFFKENKLGRGNIHFSDILSRYRQLAEKHFDAECEMRDLLDDTFDWFGLSIYSHEYRADGEKKPGCELLPENFVMARWGNYDGLADEDHWLVKLSTEDCPEEQEHMVLNVLLTGELNPEYFIWTVPTKDITF